MNKNLHSLIIMKNKNLKKFSHERNIKKSTLKGYESSLNKYTRFNKMTIEELLEEAQNEEKKQIPLKDRTLKKRLIDFRNYLLNSELSTKTARTYFSKIKAYYRHYEIEIPILPKVSYDITYETNYLDLPKHSDIKKAIEESSLLMKAIILFMISSGTAKAETLSLTIDTFIKATEEYHNGGTIKNILKELETKKQIVPTFYLKRIKTNKFYYTFCTNEATQCIIKYLKTRSNLKLEDKLFYINDSSLSLKFRQINDSQGWGFKGKYRFFRPHALRKFNASNIGLSREYVDLIQGRGKDELYNTYIKTNPKKLKKIYESAMHNVEIFKKDTEIKKEEFTIVINIFLSGKEYNIID